MRPNPADTLGRWKNEDRRAASDSFGGRATGPRKGVSLIRRGQRESAYVLLSMPSNLPASTHACSLTGHEGFFGILEMTDAPRDQYASPPNESAIHNYPWTTDKENHNEYSPPSCGPNPLFTNPRTELGPPIWKRSENSVPREPPRAQRRPERAARDRVYSRFEFHGLIEGKSRDLQVPQWRQVQLSLQPLLCKTWHLPLVAPIPPIHCEPWDTSQAQTLTRFFYQILYKESCHDGYPWYTYTKAMISRRNPLLRACWVRRLVWMMIDVG